MNFTMNATSRRKNQLDKMRKNLGITTVQAEPIDTMPPKERFRVICEENIPYIRNIDLPTITKNNSLEAVLIEYRCFPHLEFLIRNAMIKLGDKWSHTVVCGNLNYDFMVTMCANISPEINVIKTDYDNLNQSTYSLLLASKSFWELFAGEKILLYQEDSCIFKSNVDDFLQWDYVGAPWPRHKNDTPNGVGNGGFSLRTRQCMIEVIDRVSIHDTQIASSTREYMQNAGMTVCPEDVYFSKNMQDYGIGRVAGWDNAIAFSSECVYNGNSFGGHCIWHGCINWEQVFLTKIKLLNIKMFEKNSIQHIQYEIIQNNVTSEFINNKLWCHLHCFDIDKFTAYYGEYINNINKYFSVIVTYSKGTSIPNYNFCILKIPNRGMDIGGKFCCIDFLNKNNIVFDFILMLHSKSHDYSRKQYFNLMNLNFLETIVHHLDINYGVYTINLLHQGNFMLNNFTSNYSPWDNNTYHMTYIIDKLALPTYNNVFAEGNVYILQQDVANYLFDNRFNFYSILNYENSFDYSWFIHYYNVKHMNYADAYNKYLNEKLFGNNNATGKGWNGLADSMFEHAFERVPFGVCKLLNKKIHIFNYDKNKELNEFIFKDLNNFTCTASLIACHTASQLKITSLIHNIKYISEISDDIYIINSLEFKGKIEDELLNNDFITNDFIVYNNLTDSHQSLEHYNLFAKRENKKIFIIYQENSHLICYEKWYNCLKKIKEKYSHFVLTNDSFLIVKDLFNFKNKMNDNEMIGIIDSNETEYHYPDFLRMYNLNGITKWLDFYDKTKNSCKTFFDMIFKFEIKSTFITEKRDCLIKVSPNYKKNIYFDDNIFIDYILRYNHPIIKLKKLLMTSYLLCAKNNTLFEDITDFDPFEYKNLHVDIIHFSNEAAKTHFYTSGIYEGRKYKKDQTNFIPEYIRTVLPQYILPLLD